VLSLFFHFGILIVYSYLVETVLVLIALTIICSAIFWINIKYDRASDVIDVFSKTISFDLKFSDSRLFRLLRILRPLNPYAGIFGSLSGLLLVLWAAPAFILFWALHPDQPVLSLKIVVYIMSAGMCTLYYFANKDQFLSATDTISYFTGVVVGPMGIIKILS
jgi:hypothetical protein